MAKLEINISGVGELLKKLTKYRDSLEDTINELLEKITNEGVSITNVQVNQISYSEFRNPVTGWYEPTGALENSIVGVYDPVSHVGIITSNQPYAIFVEYGTGVYSENGTHGEEGWWYTAEGDSHWTKGQPGRQFMYKAAQELKEEVPRIAKEVFKK